MSLLLSSSDHSSGCHADIRDLTSIRVIVVGATIVMHYLCHVRYRTCGFGLRTAGCAFLHMLGSNISRFEYRLRAIALVVLQQQQITRWIGSDAFACVQRTITGSRDQ